MYICKEISKLYIFLTFELTMLNTLPYMEALYTKSIFQ